MATAYLTRTTTGLVPSDQGTLDWLEKIKLGASVNAEVRQPRNGKFHRKFFAMLDVAYSNHDWPEVETEWGRATVSRDLFRKYVTVKAGHYEIALTPRGVARAEPKSISWARMDEAEFSQLYSDVLDVILREFLSNWTTGDMDRAVEQMLGFA